MSDQNVWQYEDDSIYKVCGPTLYGIVCWTESSSQVMILLWFCFLLLPSQAYIYHSTFPNNYCSYATKSNYLLKGNTSYSLKCFIVKSSHAIHSMSWACAPKYRYTKASWLATRPFGIFKLLLHQSHTSLHHITCNNTFVNEIISVLSTHPNKLIPNLIET